MKLKKVFLFLFFYYFSLSLFSQKVIIKGFVKDSLQNPLTFANIIAKPKDTIKNFAFSISDEKGRYRLELEKKTSYSFSVSFMGYKTIKFNIMPSNDIIKNFTLLEINNQLDEITLDLPIKTKKDTIVYDAKRFTTGEERKLINVLKKLPGVEVDKEGTITVMGKKVTKMLVENKKFFGGNSKLAVENIPANAIDKVEVLDNYNEVTFLKDVSDSNEMAMNILLKEDKKRFFFGDIEISEADRRFYKAHSNIFYYSPKTNINFIGDVNNVGDRPFTYKDYLNFSNDVNVVFNDNFSFQDNTYQNFMSSNDFISNTQRFGAINLTKTTSNKLDVNGYFIFSHNNSRSFLETLNDYSTYIEEQEAKNDVKNILAISRLNIEYSPNENERWYFRNQAKINNQNNLSIIKSKTNLFNNTINNNNSENFWYLSNNIEWHKKQSIKHTYSVIADYSFNRNIPETIWNLTEPIFQGLLPYEINQNIISLQLNKELEVHHFNFIFKEFWVLNSNNHIYTTLGNKLKKEEFNSFDAQNLDDGSVKNFINAGFNNNANFSLNDFFFGLHYKFRYKILTFKQGVYFHNFNWVINQQSLLKKQKWVALPDFLLKLDFNNSKKIQLYYNLKSNFSNSFALSDRFFLQSYNSVFKGNQNLENELFHNASISYSRFSIYRGLLINAGFSYTKKIKGYSSVVQFDDLNQFLTLQRLSNPSENWSLNTSLRKRMKKIKYKLSGKYSHNRFLQGLNNNFTTNIRDNINFSIGAETLYEKFPVIDIGIKSSIGNFYSNNQKTDFLSFSFHINVDYNFLENFNYSFDFENFDYYNKAQNFNNLYSLANSSLIYKRENSGWSFKFDIKNIFNTKFKQSNSFSNYLITDSKTYILPRIVMFTLGYNL